MMAVAKPSTRDRLIASGTALFAERGFSGASVREICRHAETSMNMIHHYFDSKEGLLAAILEGFTERTFVVPMRLMQRQPRSKEDFRSRIEMLFEAALEAYLEHRLVAMVAIREQVPLPAAVEFTGRFSAFLQEAKVGGFVRQELDAAMVSGFMLDRILNQVLFAPWIKQAHGLDLVADAEYRRRWCASNIDLFLHGLVP